MFGSEFSRQLSFVQLNSTGGRRRSLGRSVVRLSNRGSGASSSSFILGRAELCNRRHSSIGTNTATSTPRRVTTWEPFLIAVSSNSLNRSLASCMSHEATSFTSAILIVVACRCLVNSESTPSGAYRPCQMGCVVRPTSSFLGACMFIEGVHQKTASPVRGVWLMAATLKASGSYLPQPQAIAIIRIRDLRRLIRRISYLEYRRRVALLGRAVCSRTLSATSTHAYTVENRIL